MGADGYVIILDHADGFAQASPTDFATALSVLQDAADTWREDGVPLWTLVGTASDGLDWPGHRMSEGHKQPVSVLVVIHTPALDVLKLRNARQAAACGNRLPQPGGQRSPCGHRPARSRGRNRHCGPTSATRTCSSNCPGILPTTTICRLPFSDGIIAINAPRAVDILKRHPAVMLENYDTSLPVDTVNAPSDAGSRAAIEHLIARGCARIGIVGDNHDPNNPNIIPGSRDIRMRAAKENDSRGRTAV